MSENRKPERISRRPHFGRAFNACINSDWAITPEAYRTVLAIAARLNDPRAVEAYAAEPLKPARTAKIRHGVAIIPITGPIFRYANWFTLFSGGTTVSDLARDFRMALDSPNVYSILFEINSPGGEVTGINELGDMIYAARKRKPMTARVGGLMCSAALWLGCQAGDVVIDETAQVGSIGVCTAYIDDRKAMEMRGLEEIEFISSQSPYKNAPAYTDEGRKRIQARIDALCAVFGQKVARGYGVPIEKVWKDFGQGDVFVGQKAIDVGLADRFGSFEETLKLLAGAHTPGYRDSGESEDFPEEDDQMPAGGDDGRPAAETEGVETATGNEKTEGETEEPEAGKKGETADDFEDDPEDDPEKDEPEEYRKKEKDDGPGKRSPGCEDDASTINSAAGINSLAVTGGQSADETNDKEELMKEEINDSTIPAAGTATSSADEKSAQAAPSADAKSLEERERALAERERALAEKEAEAARRQAEAEKALLRAEMDEIAKDFAGNESGEKTEFLVKLAETFGRDSAEFMAYVTDQKALAEQIGKGKLFAEMGAAGDTGGQSAEVRLDRMAKERASKEGISYFKAYELVMKENPELYARYEAEQRAAAG